MQEINFQSTSLSSATTDDIILRQTKTTRLIFRPLMVENQRHQNAAIKGEFIFQRKLKNNEWKDHNSLRLNTLKSDEWVKLPLHSEELLKLYNHLGKLYKIFAQEGGIPYGETKFVRADEGLISLLEVDETEFTQLLDNETRSASALVSRLLRWLSKTSEPEQIIESLEQMDVSDLQNLDNLLRVATLKSILDIWKNNQENSDEEFWQTTLTKHSLVLAQIVSYPLVIVEGKSYAGGKGLDNRGGNLVDFLAQNDISKNATLVEIKTPTTGLLGKKYRSVYSMSSELSGTITQVSNYKHNLEREFYIFKGKTDIDIEAFEPNCIAIIGNYKTELNAPEKRKAFDLFRSRLHGVEIITYDELFGKIELLIELLDGTPKETEEIPF